MFERKMYPLFEFKYYLFTCFILLDLTVKCIASDDVNKLGVISPRGVILEVGNPLELFCYLNLNHKEAKGHNASDLVFYRGKNIVNKAFVEVLNDTTIRMLEKNTFASRVLYACELLTDSSNSEKAHNAVDLTAVTIGYKPKEVHNFTCISHNWENLTCKWIKPENPVDTKYKLMFRLPGRAGERMQYSCSNSPAEKHQQNEIKANEGLCFWNFLTRPQYRQPYEYYYFQMIGVNQLGTVEFPWMKFHHYGHMIPSPPQNLVCLNSTHDSILLRWYVPSNVVHFPPGLTQRVDYQSTWDENEWHTADTGQLYIMNQPHHTFNLTGLVYANTQYNIRVYMKSPVAVGSDKWSRPATLTVKTMPTIPGAAPRTDIGSFEEVVIDGEMSRDVYVYWQQIPELLKNGDDFHYNVTNIESVDSRYHKPVEITSAYAKFEGLDFNSYNFTIVATNSVGESGPAFVYVPGKNDMPPEPIRVTKIAYSPSLYELSWKLSSDKDDLIENYTIFWCNNSHDRPFQCSGHLNWIHVPKNETVRNMTVPADETYQFAVSANTRYSSSGMVWAPYTVIHNKTIGKMRSVWINQVGSEFIDVGWKFECPDRIGREENFVVIFCPILLSGNFSCKEPERTFSVSPTYTHKNITGLTPHTSYMVSLAIITHGSIRQRSVRLYANTLEIAPITS